MSIFGKSKSQPEPVLPPRYEGPFGPTVCAEVSRASGTDAAWRPCKACGHPQHFLQGPCPLCQFEVRLQALEAQR